MGQLSHLLQAKGPEPHHSGRLPSCVPFQHQLVTGESDSLFEQAAVTGAQAKEDKAKVVIRHEPYLIPPD